jgi:hypothetical protein
MAKKQFHTPDVVGVFLEELKHQTDRGAGILAAAILDDVLTVVILKRFVQLTGTRENSLFGRMAPLSTFAAKIEIGFAIGLYDNSIRTMLDTIRDVRNKFAHRMESLSFDEPTIASLVEKYRGKGSPREKYSTRDLFTTIFVIALLILYVVGDMDIRIKPLDETHRDDFERIMVAIREHRGGPTS